MTIETLNEQAAARNSREGGKPPRPPLSDDRAWGVEDVAYFLNYSESFVRKLERERKLPALPRVSRRLTFDPKTVRAFRAGALGRGPN